MRALKVKNGIVHNVAVFDELPNGNSDWIAAPEGVGKGWLDNGDGTFSAPHVDTPEPTTEEKIMKLEHSITKRDIMQAVLGDNDAIQKIQDIENQILDLEA